jgi:hypothetical protein
MGNNLFVVGISKIIADVIGPSVLDATLSVVTAGTRTPGSLTAGTNPTTATHACKGFINRQANRDLQGTLVDDGRVTITLLGDTINSGNTVPSQRDRVTIEGRVFEILIVDRDPDAATYVLSCSEV